MTLVRLEPGASQSQVKHSTTEPLHSQEEIALWTDVCTDIFPLFFVACFLLFFFLGGGGFKKNVWININCRLNFFPKYS